MLKLHLSVLLVWLVLGTSATAKPKSQPNDDAFAAIMSTKFDFGETGISGEMKAPNGFFLQGKQNQSLSQMVRLRSSFKKELRTSRDGVRSLSR